MTDAYIVRRLVSYLWPPGRCGAGEGGGKCVLATRLLVCALGRFVCWDAGNGCGLCASYGAWSRTSGPLVGAGAAGEDVGSDVVQEPLGEVLIDAYIVRSLVSYLCPPGKCASGCGRGCVGHGVAAGWLWAVGGAVRGAKGGG